MNKLFAFSLIMVSLVCAGCAQHERFGHDPDIAYSTNKFVEPPLVPGRYGGSVTTSNAGDPKTFNLWIADDSTSGNIVGLLYEPLEELDQYSLKTQPRLAPMPKVSKNGLVYTFTLRPNLKWSDGHPITSDDVIFTLNVLFDPKIETLYREGLLISVRQPNGSFKHEPFIYKKIDDRTVQFTLPAPWAPAMSTFNFAIMPKHVLEPIYKSGQFNSAWGIDTPPSQLVASGPYVMSQYVAGQRVVYRRNPNFWRYGAETQHLPYLNTYVYDIEPDSNSGALSFRSGGCDEISVPLHAYPSFARYARRDNYTMIDTGAAWATGFLVFNENPTSTMSKTPKLLKLFQNQTFRQACAYAVDNTTICNILELGFAHPLYGPISPANTVFYDNHIKQYAYNLTKAKKMLLSLGCKNGTDGYLQYQGEPVKFTILVNTEGSAKDVATIMVDDYRKIGIDAQQAGVTFESMDTKISSPPYDWQTVIIGFTADAEPNDLADLWRTTSLSHIWWPKEPHPEFAWEAQIENDFNNGAVALTLAQRKRYYNDWQEIAAAQQPMIYLPCPEEFSAMRNHFGNVKPSSLGGVTWNIEELFDTHATRSAP